MSQSSNTISVSNETNTLEKIIIHAPDIGISRMSPRRAEELLFDDIVFYPQLKQEYSSYEKVLKHFCGNENVYYTEHLIEEAMRANSDKRAELLDAIVDFEELSDQTYQMLSDLDHAALTDILIHGYDAKEDVTLFDPIPNFIFTRDIAVSINNSVLLTKAAKKARQRENLLTQFIFNSNPKFADLKANGLLINMNDTNLFPRSPLGEHVSIEGGDVMLLHPDYLLIGVSERSSDHAIDSLTTYLLDHNIVSNVAICTIPAVRSYMHIDTIFTMISDRLGVAFAPLMCNGTKAPVQVYSKAGAPSYFPNVKQFLKSCIHPDIELVSCANGKSPYQEREQWTDACNLLALKNGVALAYDRNIRTAEALKEYGYQILTAEEFLQLEQPTTAEKTIISLPSSELSRARGGSHCMSLPIKRSR